MRTSLIVALVSALAVGVPVHAELFSSDFDSLPEDEGWQLIQRGCGAQVWASNGFYYQDLNFSECGPPGGGQEDWRRLTEAFNESNTFFCEFHVRTTGPGESEIPGGAPTVLSLGNSFGLLYHATVANDQVKLLRDALLPELWIDVTPDVPHTVRVELRNGTVNTYRWYVDHVMVDEGEAEGPYPVQNSRITWRGKANWQPCFNTWSYIRYGHIPGPGGADANTDGQVDAEDFYFFAECVDRSAAGEPALPSCAWADMTFDGTVDCTDWELFRDAWTDPANPPPFLPACPGPPIPTTSDWGLIVLALLVFTIGTLTFRRTGPAT